MPSLVVPEMGAVEGLLFCWNPNCRQTVVKRVESGTPTHSRIHGFTCKRALFNSGRCWFRTSDLCRVKAARWFAGGFWRLQNPCKSSYSCAVDFPNIAGDLLGLLHGCCTDTIGRAQDGAGGGEVVERRSARKGVSVRAEGDGPQILRSIGALGEVSLI